MFLLDTNGNIIDSECSFGMLDQDQCVIVESSGGANLERGISRRNPDYNKLISCILSRLKADGVCITRVILDSKRFNHLSVEDRTAVLDHEYPVDLSAYDVEDFRKMLGRAIAGMHRQPGAQSSGNAQKKIRICVDRPLNPVTFITGKLQESEVEKTINHAPNLKKTEAEYISRSRVGQGQFRKDLLARFNSKCPVTGISNPDLLLASHVKPWKVCSNTERLDPANGILLSAMIDRLFDQGLVSFSETGHAIFSSDLSEEDRAKLGHENWAPIPISARTSDYLAYHRAYQYRGS